ncbi:MAG: hypothetical protein KJ593_07680 [Candidatus Omnitrophica bacterium]|nr:hypothetical protein [Candidatus Omnitrophota bacterium]
MVKTKKRISKDKKITCNVCGLILKVDNICGCVEECDVICCGEQMKLKRK